MSEVSDRISVIADLMSTFSWYGKRSVRYHAEAWDLSEAYVAQLAREAARRVASAVLDPDLVTATVCNSLARVLDEAESDRDWRSVIQAAGMWAKLSSSGSKTDPGAADSGIDESEL